ncbi:aspartic peptidase domain-containing protein [Mycena leptocephala]|nr:aspartic peptidase domain-containing protein [Mycena leptocephala]
MSYYPKFYLGVLLITALAQSQALVLHSNITYTTGNDTLLNVASQYVTNITVNGQNFRVMLDTGSSDIFLVPPEDFSFNNTGIKVTNSYGTGDVEGTIGFASVQVGNHTFDQQAFNNATLVEVAEPLGPGIDGLLGVSFDGFHSSAIMATLDGSNWDTTLGEPFLYNIFDQTPEQNNFIGISLSRTGDLEGSADASFIINEINEAYAKVTQAPLLPIFPGNNRRWSILMDGISVDGVNITLPTSTVPNTPDGKIVVVMDTGTPSVLLPDKLVSDIYSSIPGAQSGAAPDQSGVTWTVPCNTTTIVTIYFGGEPFPIHPLDLSDMAVDQDSTTCVGTFTSNPGTDGYDGCFGDTVMRNIFNFGDAISKSPTGDASMQLLSQTDPVAAAADVLNVRMSRISPSRNVAAAPVAIATLDNSRLLLSGDTVLANAGPPLANDPVAPRLYTRTHSLPSRIQYLRRRAPHGH